MYNPSSDYPAAMWDRNYDFSRPVTRFMSPAHDHNFGVGYDLQYKSPSGSVVGRIDGLRPDEAAFLRQKHGI